MEGSHPLDATARTAKGGMIMMPASELIKVLRTGAQGLDFTVRFLILDACDRLERQIRDNELLMQKIAELRSSTVKTNADRIRAMSDEELKYIVRAVIKSEDCPMGRYECKDCVFHGLCLRGDYYYGNEEEWLKQPAED